MTLKKGIHALFVVTMTGFIGICALAVIGWVYHWSSQAASFL